MLKKEILKEDNYLKYFNNNPNLLIDNKLIHSKYNPFVEAERITQIVTNEDPEKTFIIVLGCGLGYHIQEIEKKNFKNVIIIENNPIIYNYFLKLYELPTNYKIISPYDNIEKIDFYINELDFKDIKRVKTIILKSTYNENYKEIEKRIENLIKIKLGDFATKLKFNEIWFINSLLNILNLKISNNVSKLFNLLDNKYPVLLISAGPSLKESLEFIDKNKDNFFLIAVDTSLRVLSEKNIIPDFIFSLDCQPHNLKDFISINKEIFERSVLIYDFVVNPSLASHFRYSFISNTVHLDFDDNNKPIYRKFKLIDYIEKLINTTVGGIDTGGSVATSAFHFALLLNPSDICLIGQDLAYSYYTSHSVSTPHYYSILNRQNRLKPLDKIFLDIMFSRRLLTYKDKNNNDIYTDFVLDNYKNWFEESIKNIKLSKINTNIYNETITGLIIKGIDKSNKDFPPVNKNIIINKLKNLQMIKINYNIISKFLNEMKDLLLNFKDYQNLFENSILEDYFSKEIVIYKRFDKIDEFQLLRKKDRLLKALNLIIQNIG